MFHRRQYELPSRGSVPVSLGKPIAICYVIFQGGWGSGSGRPVPLCTTHVATCKRPKYWPMSASACTSLLLDLSLTVKATTLIFISGRGSAISSAKEGKSGFIYNLVKS